jgi:ADP-heptose:LPS heptosyltransferase
MPFVEKVREQFPASHFGLVCDEPGSRVALTCGLFQDLVVYSPEQIKPESAGHRRLAELLSDPAWELAILLGRRPDTGREHLAMASGAALRVGPGHRNAYPAINCELRSPETGHYPYRRTTTWGRLLGIPLDEVPLRWPLDEGPRRQAAQLVHFNKPRKDQLLIGIDPGIGKEGTVLASENMAFLVNHMANHLRCKTIILTADTNEERTDGLRGLLRSEQLDLPRPTLKERLLLLAQCDLLLAGNTDFFHFAAAMGVPSLGIFTPKDGEVWVPTQAERVEVLRSKEGDRLSLSDLMAKVDVLIR